MKRVNYLKMVFVVLLSVLSLGFMTAGVEAFPLGYNFTMTGVSGDVDGILFHNADLLISFVGDTTNVTTDTFGANILYNLTGNLTLSGGDLGTGIFPQQSIISK